MTDRQLLEKIDELVSTDFCDDMCAKIAFREEYTQKEAQDMAQLLGLIYSYAHQIHCSACRGKN